MHGTTVEKKVNFRVSHLGVILDTSGTDDKEIRSRDTVE